VVFLSVDCTLLHYHHHVSEIKAVLFDKQAKTKDEDDDELVGGGVRRQIRKNKAVHMPNQATPIKFSLVNRLIIEMNTGNGILINLT